MLLNITNFAGAESGDDHATAVSAVASLLDDVIRHFDEDQPKARSFLFRAAEVLRRHGGVSRARPQRRGGLAVWQVNRVCSYVDRHLARDIRVSELAAIARVSESHLSRAFRVSVGMPPHAYIVASRVERAKQLMVTTADPLGEIALACGFSDQAHFSKSFRQHVGVSPNRWRRQR